jgi:hypothetical protein
MAQQFLKILAELGILEEGAFDYPLFLRTSGFMLFDWLPRIGKTKDYLIGA